MKKLLIATVTLVSLGLFASQGMAFWGGSCGGPRGGGWVAGETPRIDNERKAEYEKYAADTAGIRKELAAKQAEYGALMANDNPDPKRAGELAGEIAGLREQLRAKAPDYGYSKRGYGPGPGNAYCYGYGRRGAGPCSW
ncbi:MAG: hypothetical protein U5R49_11650 [Deltaproteobacteria bacterium]|nr:hypothetical protein [Deltaproteobacteria bacterium]